MSNVTLYSYGDQKVTSSAARRRLSVARPKSIKHHMHCRANAGLKAFATGSLFKIPHVTCDTLQLWFTGDDTVCSEGQAKSSGAFVDPPGQFRYALFAQCRVWPPNLGLASAPAMKQSSHGDKLHERLLGIGGTFLLGARFSLPVMHNSVCMLHWV